MFKKTAIIVSAALALSLSATAALAADDVDDQPTTVATCDQDRAQLRDGTGTGDCVYGDEALQTRTMTRQRDQVFSPEDCTGDGPQARAGNAAGQGNGPGNAGLGIGDGPQARSANATGNQFGRAGS
jgi:hypothetical protein